MYKRDTSILLKCFPYCKTWNFNFLDNKICHVLFQIQNKRPMGHIAHLRKQFKSINTYDDTITLIKRRKKPHYYLSENKSVLLWTKLNHIHRRMLCAKFGWNWPSGSGEEDFLNFLNAFHYFVIISPWKRAGPFIWTKLNPLHSRMLCAKFGWYWLNGSGEEDF